MHERKKLEETRYFYSKMNDSLNQREEFCYNLSAFLSSARSALQYALKECSSKGKQQWYDSQIKSSPVLTFFKDKRDINIHTEPIQPQTNHNLALTETIDCCMLARKHGFMTVISHRGGGETNDTFMVDLAVAVNSGFIKVGPSRGERVSKYNRLMEIEDELGSKAKVAGKDFRKIR